MYKIGTIYRLIDKAILLSHPIFQEKNLEYVIRVLIVNAYPIDLIFHKINHRIKELSSRSHSKKQEQNLSNNDRKMLVLPYIKNVSDSINLSINKNEYSMTAYRILNK